MYQCSIYNRYIYTYMQTFSIIAPQYIWICYTHIKENWNNFKYQCKYVRLFSRLMVTILESAMFKSKRKPVLEIEIQYYFFRFHWVNSRIVRRPYLNSKEILCDRIFSWISHVFVSFCYVSAYQRRTSVLLNKTNKIKITEII